MHYQIVHELPGRLRFRCGKWVFDSEEVLGVTEYLSELSGVSSVSIRLSNGSILVEHDGSAEALVLSALDKLDIDELPRATVSNHADLSLIDNNFQLSLIKTVGFRYLRKLLLPLPFERAYTLFQSVKFLINAIKALSQLELNVDVLDATAIGVSLLRRDFTTASSVMFMLKIADILADYTEQHTRYALRNNLAVMAESVWLVGEDGTEIEVAIDEVKLGDTIRVRTGSMIPLDGSVVDGLAEVNEASMTGESSLVNKHTGSTVHAGTVIDEGSILIKTTSLASHSRIDQIVDLVEYSQERKASAQSKAEKLADSIVPLSLGLFIAVLALTRNVTKAVSVLMVDYSCAIKLSMPVAVMSAMKETTDLNFVAKGGKYLETLASADAIVFDKTGTLTNASPAVEKVISFDGMDEDEILRLAACLEEHFPHSMARAIVKSASEKGLCHKDEEHSEVEYIVAHGIASKVDGKKVRLGSAHFIFDDEGVRKPEGIDERVHKEAPAASTVFMSVDGELVGVICISDPLRPESKDVVKGLRERGFKRIVMLTGDSENAARVVAEDLGIDDYMAQVLPEDKSSYIQRLKAEGYSVAMVGDGINDSPALAEADVSIALDDASDIARNVADISIQGDSLETLLIAKDLSTELLKRIDTSYKFIMSLNSALIALGIVGVLQPTASALLHNGSTVAIGLANTRPLLKEAR